MKVRIDPKYPERQKHGLLHWAPRHGELLQTGAPCSWVSSRELIQFSSKNPDFDPLLSKFVPQTCLLGNIHQKEIKTLANKES